MESQRKGTRTASEERIKEAHERLGSKATVYTTAYGTQYISPVDGLFSRVEMLELLEEAEALAEEEKNGKRNGK